MAEKHPNEIELLSFVEEDLGADARRDVAEHLVACRTCADQIRRLETGREALRSAPSLELPDERRDQILASLPEQPDPWRRFRPVKRALVIAAPVAATAAVAALFVVGVTQLDLGGDDDAGEASPAAARKAPATPAGSTRRPRRPRRRRWRRLRRGRPSSSSPRARRPRSCVFSRARASRPRWSRAAA